MIVIADTSPLNYLILIDLPHILQELFGEVIVPRAVRRAPKGRGGQGFSQATNQKILDV